MGEDTYHCPNCGAAQDNLENYCGQCGASLAGQDRPESSDGLDREQFGHLFGDVYWDKRYRYLVLEVIGGLLILAPPDIAGQVLRYPTLLVAEIDWGLAIWFAQNYQYVGTLILMFGILGRITIDPNLSTSTEAGQHDGQGDPGTHRRG